MKTMAVGAFEAKTRFSELLRRVEEGCVVRVFRRNRHVADLVRSDLEPSRGAMEALSRLSVRRRARKAMSVAEIRKLRDEGRKR